ncbi:hypothetical protein GCM10010508_19340 [Streptomyces naganishii JCM 4654]|uniref:Uncharacterized protein n=1 Tax=Streptomyces naganishii JCM 4654 TaxID=1306179 RepID=A0A919CUF8_9ACTN|nr:hypothetical protein GCM10010508_19340 [Streptomyces naganishii JCM 4654]
MREGLRDGHGAALRLGVGVALGLQQEGEYGEGHQQHHQRNLQHEHLSGDAPQALSRRRAPRYPAKAGKKVCHPAFLASLVPRRHDCGPYSFTTGPAAKAPATGVGPRPHGPDNVVAEHSEAIIVAPDCDTRSTATGSVDPAQDGRFREARDFPRREMRAIGMDLKTSSR